MNNDKQNGQSMTSEFKDFKGKVQEIEKMVRDLHRDILLERSTRNRMIRELEEENADLLKSLTWLVEQIPKLDGEISLFGMGMCNESILKAKHRIASIKTFLQ